MPRGSLTPGLASRGGDIVAMGRRSFNAIWRLTQRVAKAQNWDGKRWRETLCGILDMGGHRAAAPVVVKRVHSLGHATGMRYSVAGTAPPQVLAERPAALRG